MKIYEYGICGLPVVSTPLRELQNRKESFITFAKDANHFQKQIANCLDRTEQLSEQARRSSSKYSWKSITGELLNISLNSRPQSS